jgi:arginyl-tRNA synthetase
MTTSLLHRLELKIQTWTETHFPLTTTQGPWVSPCQDERHGHFQTNWALVSAKPLKLPPRDLAQKMVEAFSNDPDLETPLIAGPGFINFTFKKEVIIQTVAVLSQDPTLGLRPVKKPKRILLDFSSPNVAKQMHVGHIRSTILGESLARILKSLGHDVVTDNHLGDWGTQFGMVILGYKRHGSEQALQSDPFAHLETLYKTIQEETKTNPDTLAQARAELLKLQQGDPENRALWKTFIEMSKLDIQKIYDRLDIHFDHTLGESFYHDLLGPVVAELQAKGIARVSEGAIAVFSDHSSPPKNDPFLVVEKGGATKDYPFLIQKSDSAYLYGTTDLATVKYRHETLHIEKTIYVTDARQQQHFNQLFATVKRWGLKMDLEHVWFGTILGPDKSPIKTREGKPIKLKELLDEAEQRALTIIQEKRPEMAQDKQQKLAQIIGLGALKYADQAQNRNMDYVFEWDKMLAFDGNTAPYLINAYVRTRSLLRKAGEPDPTQPFSLSHEVELELARKVLSYGDVLHAVCQEYRPHLLCTYLYETAALFHRFFENCPVLRAETEDLKKSRLVLSKLSGDVLQSGLYHLGIQTVEEM